MYGTIAQLKVKEGMQEQLIEGFREYETLNVSGALSSMIYQMDSNANEWLMAVCFESKEPYLANAESPDQAARYEKFMACLDSEPVWNDGEIIYNFSAK